MYVSIYSIYNNLRKAFSVDFYQYCLALIYFVNEPINAVANCWALIS